MTTHVAGVQVRHRKGSVHDFASIWARRSRSASRHRTGRGANSSAQHFTGERLHGNVDVRYDEPRGSQQTVKIWDKNGVVGASLQIGKDPPNDITGILKDGDVLILTTTLRENGVPIWAVIALTLDGQTMNMAQMLQFSQTIKRGSGKAAQAH
jgi:hypothetical protein